MSFYQHNGYYNRHAIIEETQTVSTTTMTRTTSPIAEQWWDFTTLPADLLERAARLTPTDLLNLARPGFKVVFYDTLEEFWVAEALEYIDVWRRSTADVPCGICGPIGPIEHLPLVARIINELQISVREGHFWAMDEWYLKGETVPLNHPLSFRRINMEMWYQRIDENLRMPKNHLHFPTADNLADYSRSYDEAHCLIMQGGQGEAKHWAFNDPPRRKTPHPPPIDSYLQLGARITELHPLTLIQNARTSANGRVADIPTQAITVGPIETWKSDRVSIWHTGWHDNPFGIRLTALMISENIADTAVPMSLLARHPQVCFNYYRPMLESSPG